MWRAARKGPSMRFSHVAAALASLSFAILSASCLESPTLVLETDPGEAQRSDGTEPLGEAQQESGGRPFGSKEFPFVVARKDDGKEEGGGWQTANATLHFVFTEWGIIPTYQWQCRLEIGMPLRTELEGRISQSRAAMLSAEIANDAADSLEGRDWKGQGALFCIELKDGMQKLFVSRYLEIGARVNQR
jgi:hypothetical protein